MIRLGGEAEIFRVADAKNDWESLQKEVRTGGDWAIKGQIKYNVDKCKVMHMRKTTLTTYIPRWAPN